MKRRMRGGRGGSNKWVRNPEGSKGPVEPPLPKPRSNAVPFVCELCQVTCETQVTFDSHLRGRKHAANLHHFQEQQTLLGHAALEALYPALEAALQGNYQTNPDGSAASQDPQAVLTQVLSSVLAPNTDGSAPSAPQLEGGQDPQAVLTQLLASIIASGQAVGPPLNPNPENLPIQSEARGQEDEPAVVVEKKAEPGVEP